MLAGTLIRVVIDSTICPFSFNKLLRQASDTNGEVADTSCLKVPHNLLCVLLHAYAVFVIVHKFSEVVKELWILLLYAFADMVFR